MTRRRRIEAIVVAAIISTCTAILVYQFCFNRTFLYQRVHLLFATGRYDEALPLYEKFLKRYSADEYAQEAREELRKGKDVSQRDAVVLSQLQEQCKEINARGIGLREFAAIISGAAGVTVLVPIGIDKYPDTKLNLDVRLSASFETILNIATKQKNLTWLVRNQAVIITDGDTIPAIEDKHLLGEHLKGANREIIAEPQKECGMTFPAGETTLEDLRQLIAPLAGVNIMIDAHSNDPVLPPETLPLPDSPFVFHVVNPEMTFENILNNVSAILDADWIAHYRTVIIAEPKVISAIEKRDLPKELPESDQPEYLMSHAVWTKLRNQSGITFPGGETTLNDLRALVAPLAEVNIIIDPYSRAPDKLPLAESPFTLPTVTGDLTFEDILNIATMFLRADWTVRNRAVTMAEPDVIAAIKKRPQVKEQPLDFYDAQVWEKLQNPSGITFPGGETTLEEIRALIAPLAEVNMIIDPYSRTPDGLPLADSPFVFQTVTGDLTFEDILNSATTNFLRADWTIRNQAVIVAQPGRIDSAELTIRDGRLHISNPKHLSPHPLLPPLIADLKHKNRFVGLRAAETLGMIGAPAVRQLIAALKDKDKEVRKGAAMALGMTEDSRSVKPLIDALNDEDPDVRGMAASALGWIKDPRSVEPLTAAMDDKDSGVRRRAAWALGRIGDSRVVQTLIVNLQDYNRSVRWQIEKTLGRMKDPRAIAPLIGALKKGDRAAARALIEIGKPAVDPLIAALKDDNSWKWRRADVARTLGALGDARAVQPLISILRSAKEEMRVRTTAARSLGMIGDARAVEPLVAAFLDEESALWNDTMQALGMIGNALAVEPLIAALKDKREHVRWHAADALGRIKDTRAIEPLIAALEDEQQGVRVRAIAALYRITGKNLGRDSATWQRWWIENRKSFR